MVDRFNDRIASLLLLSATTNLHVNRGIGNGLSDLVHMLAIGIGMLDRQIRGNLIRHCAPNSPTDIVCKK